LIVEPRVVDREAGAVVQVLGQAQVVFVEGRPAVRVARETQETNCLATSA
jgi:hypothetical protein